MGEREVVKPLGAPAHGCLRLRALVHIGRRLDPLVAKIGLRRAAMRSYGNIHREHNCPTGEPTVRRIVRFGELLVRQVGYHSGAIVEGIGEEFDDSVFVNVGRGSSDGGI